MKRYNKFGQLDKKGKYDQYGQLLKKENLIKKIKRLVNNYKQKRMIIPTEPEEIKRRANLIRQEIHIQKQKRLELADLNKDLELIKFHARMNGKIKLDDLSYEDQREKQDTKEYFDNIDKDKKQDSYLNEDN